ncbi:hypothetical protein ACO1O0_004120 [Amphichorda felina]
MSDNDVGTEGKSGAWTEAAKALMRTQFQFLLRIVAQLKEDSGRSISWTKLNMPGRTTKSLQNMWTKIQKDIAALETGGEDGAAATPKKAAARKPGGKKAAAEEDDGEGTPSKATPKKRGAGANTAAKLAKKPKKEESDEEEDVKEEESGA